MVFDDVNAGLCFAQTPEHTFEMAAPLGPFVGRLSGSLARHDGGMVAALLRVSGFVPEAGSLLAQPAQHGDQWNRAKVWTQASASGTAEELEDYCEEKLPSPWAELLVAHLQALVAIQKREYVEAYSAHAQVVRTYAVQWELKCVR